MPKFLLRIAACFNRRRLSVTLLAAAFVIWNDLAQAVVLGLLAALIIEWLKPKHISDPETDHPAR